MNSAVRPRAWLPLAVFALCVAVPLSVAQPPMGSRMGPPPGMGGPPGMGNMPGGNMPGGTMPGANLPGMVEEKMWTCGKCKHSWAANGPTPEKCPKCGTVFNEVQNADGTTTKTAAGRRSMYIGIAVVVIAILVAIVKGVVSMSSGSSRPKKKKKKVRRPRDDDDDDY